MSAKSPAKIATRREKFGAAFLFIWYFLIMLVIPEFIASAHAVSDTFALYYEIFTYASLIAGSIIVFGRRLRRDFRALCDDWRAYVRWFFPRAGIIYLIYFGVALVSTLLGGKQSENQIALTDLSIWFMAPMACLYAPLVEECVFRGAVRRFISHDWVYIIVSGLLFGLIHVVGEASLLDAVVLSLPYCAIGCGAAYLYTQSGNMFTNISYHFLHNSIAVFFLILLF